MGNLQIGDSKPVKAKSKSKVKLRGKKGKFEDDFTGVVSDVINKDEEEMGVLTEIDEKLIVTESWRKVNTLSEVPDIKNVVTPPSSCDSHFTDPQTPSGYPRQSNESVHLDVEVPSTVQESFLHDLTLNSFKLNEYRVRQEEEKCKKLNKLGVSRTSQISLDSNPSDCFVSDNVEIVSQVDDDNISVGDGWLEREDTLKRPKKYSDNDDNNVTQMVKRMSEVNLNNGNQQYNRTLSAPVDFNSPSQENILSKRTPSLGATLTRPKLVPDKLDYQLYQKFEGHMLVNWYLSELIEDPHISELMDSQEIKLLALHFCNLLLAAGVLKQIQDKGVPVYNVFKPDCMYNWTHTEPQPSTPLTPGRLSIISWPPGLSSEQFKSPCGTENELQNSTPEENNSCRSRQEMRNSARDVEILALEDEIKRLKQEHEKYKTLIGIQILTSNAVKDFSSPVQELKICDILDNKEHKQAANRISQCNSIAQTETIQSTIGTQTEDNKVIKETQTDDLEDIKNEPEPDISRNSMQSEMAECKKGKPTPPPPPPLPQSILPSAPLPQPNGDGCRPPPPPPLPISISQGLLKIEENDTQPIKPPPPPPPLPPIQQNGINPPPPPPPPLLGIPGPPQSPGCPPPPPLPGCPPPPPLPGCPPPPPPPGGPVPLPPPPVGGWNAQKAVFKKPKVNLTVPMKPLYWTRIVTTQDAEIDPDSNPTANSALWKEIDELQLENLPEFMELFSRKVISRTGPVKKVQKQSKLEPVKLLDSKRSRNVGILAQSLRVDTQEIENAIYNCDTSTVSLEALQQIYEVKASEEELDMIKAHLANKPDIPLDRPEQFLYDLSEISHFAERIACLMFQVEFDDSINTIGHTLTNIKTTCDYLISSSKLKDVMAIILTLGNLMNGGNMSRGQADGFGLEILSKLKDVKSSDSKITLLHFIVKTYMKKIDNPLQPNLALPVPEPDDIRRAAQVNFDDIKLELEKLQSQLESCEKTTKIIIDASTPENLQPFKDKMIRFIEHSKKQAATEFEFLDECHKQFIATMKFYLFKPKRVALKDYPPNLFFELWLPFCVDFKDVYKMEMTRLEKERQQQLLNRSNQRTSGFKKIKEREDGLKAKVRKLQEKNKERKERWEKEEKERQEKKKCVKE